MSYIPNSQLICPSLVHANQTNVLAIMCRNQFAQTPASTQVPLADSHS